MKTAVEWLAEKMLYIDNEYDMKLITKSEYQAKRRDIVNQAKEMEKEQIMQAFANGKFYDKNWAHRYYNETFKSE
jgi:hypothetical protein